MNGYGEITNKYIKKNKKRTVFTIVGIILSLALISGIGFLGYSFKDFMIENAKANGDYEIIYRDLSKEQVDILKNDVDLSNVGISKETKSFKLKSEKENYISIDFYDKGALDNVIKLKVTEGVYPNKSNEIVISKRVKEKFNVEIGQSVELNEISYTDNAEVISEESIMLKVVGFTDEKFENGNYYSATSYLDISNSEDKYKILFSLGNAKNKMSLANDKAEKLGISLENVSYNNKLLALSGESSREGINTVITGMVIIVLIIIILATIFLIYNAINISVAERMNQFATLRSLGATPGQIKELVLREGLVMCLIAVPFGVISGYLGVFVTVKLLETQIINAFGEGKFSVNFYPMVILITLVVGIATILIASYGPAKSASKVSPIEGIRNNGGDSSEKIKFYKGNLVRKIFGLEGWVAYKNIRKNSKRFAVTILSLSISLILFSVFTTINVKRVQELEYIKNTSLAQGTIYTHGNKTYTKVEKDLEKISGIEKLYTYGSTSFPLVINNDKITSEFKEYYGPNIIDTGKKDYSIIPGATLNFYNDIALNEIGIKDEDMAENEVILINNVQDYNDEGKLNNTDITDLKEGDTINLPKTLTEKNATYGEAELAELEKLIKDDIENENYITFRIKKVIDRDVFREGYGFQFGLILNEKSYIKLPITEFQGTTIFGMRYGNGENYSKVEEISKEIEEVANDQGVTFMNEYEETKRQEEMWLVINVFVYGFIVMITLIGIVNVVNTISLNILLKKREFGTLGTIGMDRSQLRKMIMLEGVLHGVISSIIGGIISIILIIVMMKIMGQGFTVTNSIPISPLVIGIVGVFIVTLLASLIPLKKLNKISLVDTIRNIE